MCRTQGRRCPSCSGTAGRESHNARRRHNRTIRREIARWAENYGEPPEIVRLLQQAPPSAARQWAAKHDAHEGVPPLTTVTASGNRRDSAPPNSSWSWLTPHLIDQIRAAITTQGRTPDERDLLAGTEMTVTNVQEGTNDTVAVTLSTGAVGFHKSFRGASISVARAYQQDGYQQPLHEVAAWRVAATLGAPWIEIVTPTVIRTINNEPGSFAGMMTGYEGETSPHYLRHAAALFDALIGQQDRHSGNYLTNGINGLGLIDHGYAFARPGDSCNFSEFVADRHSGGRTADLTEHERSALNRLLHSPRLADVEGIIQPDRVAALGQRAGRMLQENRIVATGDY
jgi:hypothetical protein